MLRYVSSITSHDRQIPRHNPLRQHPFQGTVPGSAEAPDPRGKHRHQRRLFGHSGYDEVWTEGTKEMLDDMHKRKIDMADGIYVINVGGYIGQSTRSEIEYARSQGKSVEFLEEA